MQGFLVVKCNRCSFAKQSFMFVFIILSKHSVCVNKLSLNYDYNSATTAF